MSVSFPRSMPEFVRMFPDDSACGKYLESIRWPDGFTCGKCGERGEPFRFAARPSVLRCRVCRADNSLTAGTVMHRTHSPLTTWIYAAYLVDHDGTVAQLADMAGCATSTAQEVLAYVRSNESYKYRGWPRLCARLGLHGEPRKRGPKPQALVLRFARHTKIGTTPKHRPELGPCRIWTGATYAGYGVLTVDSRTELAHRIAWSLAHGRASARCILHACDNRACVRIEHLFEGTRPDNTADMLAKGRGTQPRLTRDQIAEVELRLARGERGYRLAEEFAVSPTTISSIKRGKYGRAYAQRSGQ
jgi:hypothetical protein